MWLRKSRNQADSLHIKCIKIFFPELEPPPPDPSLLPPAHPTWPGPGMMLPPPYPPKRVYYSYFERRHQDEAFDDEEIDVNVKEAGRLKREADQEHNMNERCRKYLLVSRFIVGSQTFQKRKVDYTKLGFGTLELVKDWIIQY